MMMENFKQSAVKILVCCLSLLILVGNTHSAAQTASRSAPVNLGDFKRQLTQYHQSGRYDRDVAAVLTMAEQYVERRAPMVRKPALILDIDETALSNWPQIQANDYGRITNGPCELPAGPCGQIAWQGRAEDEPLRPTLKLFQKAKAMGAAVFFITGRSEILRAATEANLRKAGYDGWVSVIMRPAGTTTPSAADFKVPERAKIMAQGFTIIANVGDQPSDLAGGYAERTFLVPNPFYRIP